MKTPLALAIFLCGLCLRPALAVPTARILSDPALPHQDTVLAQLLTQTLATAGYSVTPASVDQMQTPGTLTPATCALLVLPQARELPVSLAAPVAQYLHGGGHLLALGVPAWDTPLIRDQNGKWVSTSDAAEALALTPPAHLLFDFGPNTDLSAWQRSSNTMGTPTREELTTATANGRTAGALHVVIPDLEGWDTFLSPPLTAPPFPDGRTMTVLSAHGGPRTHALAVEWDEQDGSRWIATVPLSTHWRRYSLPPGAFHSWANSDARAAAGFHPADAVRCSLGLAFSPTEATAGAHEYWVSDFGTATDAEAPAFADTAPIEPLDTLTPSYKFFDIHGPARLTASPEQTLISPMPPQTRTELSSMQPRPDGAGFAKGRGWRWVPLLTATDPRTGQWRGVPATLMLHAPGQPFGGGAWAAFAVSDPAFYRQPTVQRAIGQVAKRMREGLFLMEAGAEFYTEFPGQSVRLGALVSNLAPAGETTAVRQGTVRVRATASGRVAWQQSWPIQAGRGQSVVRQAAWTPPRHWPAGGYTVTTELLEKGQVVDTLTHHLDVWTPPAHPDWVTIRPDGHFYLDGRLWRVNGVNYMPSSGIGQPDPLLYERWLSKAAYDPEAVERDLVHIQDLGLNAVSVFLYAEDIPSQNLLDLLRRCRAHHLRVNLSLRPGVSNELQEYDRDEADRRSWDTFRAIITHYRLPENDTIFAYEIDWEPDFARYGRQRRTDSDWAAGVNAHYGSVAAAEQAWGVPAPRDAQGNLTGPSGAQLTSPGGPDTKMIAAYRHFLDDWLAETYGRPARQIRAIAPHQYVSFRMTGASDPLWDDGGESYQFAGLSRAVDFLSPESYGQIGHGEGDLAVQFRIAYGRSVAPREPILWAETGMSVWDEKTQSDDPEALTAQGTYYARFYQLARAAGADGVTWWWYPGGYRVGEGSDFGLINPDGTDRPATSAIRREGRLFLASPPPASPDVWLDYNRDRHPNGAIGVFQELKGPFAAALAQGHHPGLRSQARP